MKHFKLSFMALAATTLLLSSCSKDVDESTPLDEANATQEVPQEILDIVKNIELNDNFVRYGDFHFPDGSTEERLFIEDDIAITEADLRELAENIESQNGNRQYRTYNLVDQGRTISIIGFTGGSQALSSKARTALQYAVNNYNNLSGVSISFSLTFGTNYYDKDMVVYDNSINESGSGGVAGFPNSSGDPYKYVQIYNLEGYSTDVNEHVITHEIGHSVGFRHTDWFSRQSCGQNVNEGQGYDGAVHVNGTPTGYDSTSIMLACFNSGVNGEFNGNDITALQNMY